MSVTALKFLSLTRYALVLVITESLYVFANKLTGKLPTELGQLYRLQEFQAQQNHLEGSLPLQIGMLNKLGKAKRG